jgi:hypothetical protein
MPLLAPVMRTALSFRWVVNFEPWYLHKDSEEFRVLLRKSAQNQPSGKCSATPERLALYAIFLPISVRLY